MEKANRQDEEKRKRAKRETRRLAHGRGGSTDTSDAFRGIDPTRCVFRPLPDLRGR